MNLEVKVLWDQVNRAIIKYRGVYSAWSKKHGISYNEMLVLYTIRDNHYCTQKQLCDSYLLPRQTMNHVFTKMCKDGIIEISEKYGQGREKAFVLTEYGKSYAKPFIESLNSVEERAVELMGKDRILSMTTLVQEFDIALCTALEENE